MRPRRKPVNLNETIKQGRIALNFYAHIADKQPAFDLSTYPQKRENRVRKSAATGLTELQIQIRIMTWWDKACASFHLPEFSLFAIPNGGGRSAIDAANLKRSGVRAGVLDLCLAAPRGGYHGLYIELKTEKGRISEEQFEFAKYLQEQGYKATIERSPEGAIDVISAYLNGTAH